MDCVSPIWSIATDLLDCTAKRTSHIRDLKENLECLREEMELLNLRSEDVKTRVELAKEQQMTPTRVVEDWLRLVGEEKNEVDAILKEGDGLLQKKCLGRCRNIRLSNDLGNQVNRKISRVMELTKRGREFRNVVYRSSRAVVELPLRRTVGLDQYSLHEQVCYWLDKDDAGIVGLYGKGGIGKTTLMKKINNGLIGTSYDFDTVIWVEMSPPQEAVSAAQQAIGNRLQIIDHSIWKNRSQHEIATQIFNIMKPKRYLLLLDDVQKPLDLLKIGVPLPNPVNRSKVIITSRSMRVCQEMKAQIIHQVKPLEWEDAWTLFTDQIRGEDTLNSSTSDDGIQQFARAILTRCQGFPSAIIMVGRALAAHQILEWEQLTQELDYLIRREILDWLPQAVEEMPLGHTVGLDLLSDKVCRCLNRDVEGAIIGICGKEGVGKTTLMKKINNRLLAISHDFDLVIWVSLPEQASVEDVQEVIRNKLQIIDSMWQNRSRDEKATEIFNIMKETRFLLLLDNVTEEQPFDFSETGVPHPSYLTRNSSKVIISTRSMKTCNEMGARRIFNVEPLQWEDAWSLFSQLIGEDTLNSSNNDRIQQFVRTILRRCQGLPSAIAMVAQALAGRNVEEWEQSTQELEYLIRRVISGKDRLPQAVVEEMPLGPTVGLDSLFDQVCKCLTQYEGAVIGLYGIGGVGKTTLMKKINNEFLKTSYQFDIVIWVSVSKQACVRGAQEVIRNKLHILDSMWQNRREDERATEIFNIMKTKRFVLLLDDVWQRFDISKIGVPKIEEFGSGCKVIITTRSQQICDAMGVRLDKKFRVEVLAREEAMTLFLKKVGKKTLNCHPDIQQLSEKVAEWCKGLPLALVTVGQAMANKSSPEAWNQAIEEMDKFPSEILGIEDGLFHVLKLSYDSLRDGITKSCFIYCSLFPKEYRITKDEVIEHWIGEGFFDREGVDIYEGRERGHKIIEDLKNACLLEEVDGCIKMHDVIHDMALWIAQECGQNRNKIWACESLGRVEGERVTKWKEAERISMWGGNIKKLPESPTCSNLQTLFMRECIQLTALPRGFFQFMPLLRVLDFSASHCSSTLPDGVERLINLEYINLSMTIIRELPTGISKLKKLRCLLLDGVALVIEQGLISGLSSLQLFSMYDGNALSVHRVHLLEELESIKPLDELSLSFRSGEALNKLLTSYKLQVCIRRLSLGDCKDLILLKLSPIYLKNLETIVISKCPELGETKINVEKEGSEGLEPSYGNPNPELIVRNKQYFLRLRDVKIWSCPKLLNLTWLIYAMFLRSLNVQSCESMEEVISSECISSSPEHASIFTRLTSMVLGGMPKLRSIYDGALHLASLEVITVINCPNLKRLPLNSNSATNSLKKIEGDLNWWNNLEWEDGSSMEAKFVSYFSPQFLANPINRSGEMKGKKKLVVVEQGETSGEAT